VNQRRLLKLSQRGAPKRDKTAARVRVDGSVSFMSVLGRAPRLGTSQNCLRTCAPLHVRDQRRGVESMVCPISHEKILPTAFGVRRYPDTVTKRAGSFVLERDLIHPDLCAQFRLGSNEQSHRRKELLECSNFKAKRCGDSQGIPKKICLIIRMWQDLSGSPKAPKISVNVRARIRGALASKRRYFKRSFSGHVWTL
jgi:hypothetical protein